MEEAPSERWSEEEAPPNRAQSDANPTSRLTLFRRDKPRVDPNQNGKAYEIHLFNISRPHMRAFHCSWISFFMAFFVWFAIIPLLPFIEKDLGLSKNDMWVSNILNLVADVFARFVLGPACEIWGPRRLTLAVLCFCAIPTALVGVIQSRAGLFALRFFIGFAGGSFVICQCWSIQMFTDEVVGLANGLIAGWGNLGGGVTQLVVGTGLLPLFQRHMSDSMAWRTVSLVPAAMSVTTAIVVYFVSDDSPHCKSQSQVQTVENSAGATEQKASTKELLQSVLSKRTTWILFIHYACSFGVELTVFSTASSYFHDVFGLSHASASAAASVFGWMNIFSRGSGGWLSDLASSRYGFKGRIAVQIVLLTLEGICLIVLAFYKYSFAGAMGVFVLFAITTQAAEGSTYGIVPFADKKTPGTVAGAVGAGGNLGGVVFTSLGLLFSHFGQVFLVIGICTVVSAPLALLIQEDELKPKVKDDLSTSLLSDSDNL